MQVFFTFFLVTGRIPALNCPFPSLRKARKNTAPPLRRRCLTPGLNQRHHRCPTVLDILKADLPDLLGPDLRTHGMDIIALGIHGHGDGHIDHLELVDGFHA